MTKELYVHRLGMVLAVRLAKFGATPNQVTAVSLFLCMRQDFSTSPMRNSDRFRANKICRYILYTEVKPRIDSDGECNLIAGDNRSILNLPIDVTQTKRARFFRLGY